MYKHASLTSKIGQERKIVLWDGLGLAFRRIYANIFLLVSTSGQPSCRGQSFGVFASKCPLPVGRDEYGFESGHTRGRHHFARSNTVKNLQRIWTYEQVKQKDFPISQPLLNRNPLSSFRDSNYWITDRARCGSCVRNYDDFSISRSLLPSSHCTEEHSVILWPNSLLSGKIFTS